MGPDVLLILVVVLVVLLIARGPKMLPRIGEALGKTVKGAREEIPGALRDDMSEAGGSTGSNDSNDKAGS